MKVTLLFFVFIGYLSLSSAVAPCLQPNEESLKWYRAYNCRISWITKNGKKCYDPPLCEDYCTMEINNAWVTMDEGQIVSKPPNKTETYDGHGLVIIRYPGYNCSCDPQSPDVPLVGGVKFPPAMHCNVSYMPLFPPECLRPTAAELAPYRVYNCFLKWFRIWNKCGKFNCYRPPVCENSCKIVVSNKVVTIPVGQCQSQPATKTEVTLPDLTIVVTTQPGWNCCCLPQTLNTQPVGGVPFPPKMKCTKLLPPPTVCLLSPTPDQIALYSTYNCRLVYNLGYGGQTKCYKPPACSNQCKQTVNNVEVVLNLGEELEQAAYSNFTIVNGSLVVTGTPGFHCACVNTSTNVTLLGNVPPPPHMECKELKPNTTIPCITPTEASLKLYASSYCSVSFFNIKGQKCYQPPSCQYKCSKVYNGQNIVLNQGEVFDLPKKKIGNISYPGYYCSCEAAVPTAPLIENVPAASVMKCHPQ